MKVYGQPRTPHPLSSSPLEKTPPPQSGGVANTDTSQAGRGPTNLWDACLWGFCQGVRLKPEGGVWCHILI